MRFGDPQLFHWLWAAAALALFFSWALKRRRQLTAQFADDEVLPHLVPPRAFTSHKTRAFWLLMAFVFLIAALAKPRWGFQWEDLHQEGVDVIVAVDVSASMLAQDIKPSRLERAKRKVADLLKLLQGDRFGLIAFAGTSFVQCPLTLDYGAAEMFLSAIEPDLIPVPGTSLGHAIRTATGAFSQKEKKSKALILITDGEDHEGETLEAAKEAAAAGVKIFVIGIGQPEGVPIPDPAGGFKKDDQGNVVLSKIDEALLQKVAEKTGGSYVRSVTGDLDLEEIYLKEIKEGVETKELKNSRRRRWQERFQWFIGLALVCLMVERSIRER